MQEKEILCILNMKPVVVPHRGSVSQDPNVTCVAMSYSTAPQDFGILHDIQQSILHSMPFMLTNQYNI